MNEARVRPLASKERAAMEREAMRLADEEACRAYWMNEGGTPEKPLAGVLQRYARHFDRLAGGEHGPAFDADVAYVAEALEQVGAGALSRGAFLAATSGRQRFRYCAAHGWTSDEGRALRALAAPDEED
jgi:hypothetical protein